MLRGRVKAGAAMGLVFTTLGFTTNVACDLFARLFRRHESVTFSRISVQDAAFVRA
jgi:hypothetical protein